MLAKVQRPVIGRLSELLVSRCRPALLDAGTTRSPNGSPNGGVGLAIVAALDHAAEKNAVVFSPRSCSGGVSLIPVDLGKTPDHFPPDDEEENYTHVTTRGPHRISTRIYYDGGEISGDGSSRKSPERMSDQVPAAYPTSDFLRSCDLCGKNLEGSDIFMYREKAYCTPECRSKQMRRDEKNERCGSEAKRSTEVAKSGYGRGEIFSTGILAI